MRPRVGCPYLADLHARWDGELPEARSAALQAHASSCPVCREEERALERLSAALRQGDVDNHFSPSEHEGLKASLLERCAHSLAAAAPESVPSRTGWRGAALWTSRAWVPAALGATCTVLLVAAAFPVLFRAREFGATAGGPTIARRPAAARSMVMRQRPLAQPVAYPPAPLPRGAESERAVALVPSFRSPGDRLLELQPSASSPVSSRTLNGHLSEKMQYNPNAYLSNTYIGGTGERDRLEALIRDGVVVQGKRVRLEAFDRSYAEPFPIPTQTALNLIAGMERTKIVQQGGHTYLQVGLQAMKGEMPRRPPLNLALVIDCSGSMGEERKLEFARQAALRLVDQLRPEDTFALVAFNDSARLLVPAQRVRDRARVKAEIAALTPGGGTNIYAGLQLGQQQARRHASPETVSRVLLLSDGEVTAGVTDAHQFEQLVSAAADHDVQTTTVGVGIDFNEDLMLEIARAGQGNYHFLRDAADTQRVFAQELNELTHVVARAIRLRIRLADGVGLVRVLGAATLDAGQTRQVKAEEQRIDRKVYEELGITPDRQREPDEPGLKLLIPSFYRGDHHVVMLEVALPPGHGRRKVADVFLKYKDLVGRANRTAQAAVAIDYTPSRAATVASIDRGVKKNLLGFQTGEALAAAAALIQQGKIAAAVRTIDERMVVLGVAAREWGDHDLDRDGRLLDRYKTVLAQLSRQPQMASGALGQYLRKSLTYSGYRLTR